VSGAVDDFEVPGGELVERDPPFTRIEEPLVAGWSLIVPENLASTVFGRGSGAPWRGEQVAVGSRGDRLPQ
jgi:hypothetical protein